MISPENTHQKSLILYVDDEIDNLQSFKSIFRRQFNVFLASSAFEGIKILEEHPIELVISDQRMPQMSGVDFLEKVAAKYPEIGRIIMTGYSDIEATVDAINRSKVYKYIKKPWNHEELQKAIESALEATRLRRENQFLLEDLQKANKELEAFMYCLSHDLRSPLASARGLISLARMAESGQEQEDIFKLQEKTLQRMDDFIQDILDYSRNNRSKLDISQVHIKDICQDIFEQLQEFDGAKQIEKIIEYKEECPFYSDKRRLDMILSNLISNAIRYADLQKIPPTVKVKIVVNQTAANISIIDNGIGIPSEHQEKVFEMFYRATDYKTGSGIGLFIVKEAVDKLLGKISLHSQIRKGTTFDIEIPNLYQEHQ